MKKVFVLLICLSEVSFAAAPPAMTWDNGGFTAGTSCGGTFSGVTTADLVIMVLYAQSTTISSVNMTDGGGGNTWHIIGPVNGTGNSSFIAWTIPTNTFASAQWNWTGSATGDCAGARYTSMAGVGTVADCNSTGSSGNSTSLTSGACPPSAANDLIVAVGGTLANSITYTPSGSYAVVQQDAHSAQGNSYGFIDVNATDCTSQSATMAASGSAAQWSMIMAAFKTSSPSACSSSAAGPSKTKKLERAQE